MGEISGGTLNELAGSAASWRMANPVVEKLCCSCAAAGVSPEVSCGHQPNCDDLIIVLAEALSQKTALEIAALYVEVLKDADGVEGLLQNNVFFDREDVPPSREVNSQRYFIDCIVREVAHRAAVDHGLTQELSRGPRIAVA